ncbi:MAG TPA: hypothetical protein VIJ79_13200 [Acidobacteriaceae bacterium]
MFSSGKPIVSKVNAPILLLAAYGLMCFAGDWTGMQRLYTAILLSPLAVLGLWLAIVLVEIRVSIGDNYVTAINYWRRDRISFHEILCVERRFIGFDSMVLRSGRKLFYVRGPEDEMLKLLFETPPGELN